MLSLERTDRHARILKQVDRSKAFFRTRIPIAKPIVLVYHYKVVACLSFCLSRRYWQE
jgi:hypothetical protein